MPINLKKISSKKMIFINEGFAHDIKADKYNIWLKEDYIKKTLTQQAMKIIMKMLIAIIDFK